MYVNYPHKIVATIEARMNSSRLPGKVLLPLAGKPMLQRIIERLQRSKYIDEIMVATTTNDIDDVLVKLAEKCGVSHFRGNEEDVLGRVFQAAQLSRADIIVRATGDNPLIDAGLIDQGMEMFFEKEVDYLGNSTTKSFPTGLSLEIFSTSVLEEVEKIALSPADRSHVSSFIYQHPEKYKLYLWKAEGTYFFPELRITVDKQADYELIQTIYKRLLPKNEYFNVLDIIELVKKEPGLLLINKDVRQKSITEL